MGPPSLFPPTSAIGPLRSSPASDISGQICITLLDRIPVVHHIITMPAVRSVHVGAWQISRSASCACPPAPARASADALLQLNPERGYGPRPGKESRVRHLSIRQPACVCCIKCVYVYSRVRSGNADLAYRHQLPFLVLGST